MNKENAYEDPLHYEEMLHAAGWKVFQRDQGNYFAAHHLTGKMVEIYTDHEDLESRSEEENQVWDRSWACYMLFEAIGETVTEPEIKKRQKQQEKEELLS